MKVNAGLSEVTYGQGMQAIQLLHANAYFPEVYRTLIAAMGHDQYTVHMPLLRPLWPAANAAQLRDWSLFADDLIVHMDQHRRRGVIGIGHSLGAIVSWLAAIKRPDLFSRLILIDPVILPPKMIRSMRFMPIWLQRRKVPLIRISSRRRDHWPDRRALEEHLRSKKVFQRFDTAVWADFKTYGVNEDVDGGVRLRFPREWESRIYSTPPNIWKYLNRDTCPITIIKAQYSDVITSDTWQRLNGLLDRHTLIEMQDVGHLVPFEKPLQLADQLITILGQSRNSRI